MSYQRGMNLLDTAMAARSREAKSFRYRSYLVFRHLREDESTSEPIALVKATPISRTAIDKQIEQLKAHVLYLDKKLRDLAQSKQRKPMYK